MDSFEIFFIRVIQLNGPIAEIRKDLVYQLRIFYQTCFIDKVTLTVNLLFF